MGFRILRAIGLMLALSFPALAASADLTEGANWECRGADATPPALQWPKKWVTFTPWEYEAGNPPRNDEPASFTNVPAGITLNGISACRATLPTYARGVLDLTVGQGAPRTGLWAYAFAEMESEKEQDMVIRVRTCGPLTWWLDGKQAFATGKAGAHSFPAHLTKGQHICAARIASGAREWNLSGSIGPAPAVEARCEFAVTDPSQFVSLTYTATEADTAQLNGQPLPVPIPGMNYEQVPLPVTLLKPGRNVLAQSVAPGGKLSGWRAEDAAIQWGPVITHATGTHATIVCRTNALVPATLRVDTREFASRAGVIHRWTVDGLKPGAAYPYTVTPGRGAPQGGTVHTLPATGRVTIGFAGDPQSGEDWKDIARAAKKEGLNVLVLAGDLVADGLSDELWSQTFFAPGAELLANVPTLAVLGNHDRRSPVFDCVFAGRPGALNWSQDIGNALLIGIDGGLDWSPGSESAKWLEAALTENQKPFVFVATHYPVYSSRNHGKLAEDGRVLERASRIARTQILPLLEKHHVTALFSGHDHGYERSELPSGLTAIVTAGAGAGFYAKLTDAARANPYSKVFAQKHHYSFVKVEGDTAAFAAVTAEGEVLDTRTWTAAKRRQPE